MRVDINDDNDKLIVYTSYDEKETIKQLPTATAVYKNKKFLYWEAPANEESLDFLESYTDEFTPNVIAAKQKLDKKLQAIEFFQAQSDIDIDYQFKIPPLEHQKVDMKFIAYFKRCLLGHQTGVGKTFPALVAFEALHKAKLAKRCVYICPLTILYKIQREIEKCTNLSSVFVSGQISIKKRKIAFQMMQDGRADILLINYDMLSKYLDVVNAIIENQYLIADEATRIKNPNTAVTKAFFKLSPKWAVLMSATFVANTPLDVYAPLQFVKPYYRNYWHFQSEHCEKDFFGGIVGFKGEIALKRRLGTVCLRRLKSEVLQLPPFDIQDIELFQTKEMKKDYKKLRDEGIMTIEQENGTLNQIVVNAIFIKMQQLTDGLKRQTDIIDFFEKNPKYDAVVELLHDALASGERTLVWCWFVPMVKRLFNDLTEKGFKTNCIYGETKLVNRQQSIDDINNGTIDCLIAQPVTTNLGLDITGATRQIFYSVPLTPLVFDQCLGRSIRHLQDKKVTIQMLLYRDSFESMLLKRLRSRISTAMDIHDDKRKMTKDEVLEILKNG